MSEKEQKPCHAQACNIQNCLQSNGYNEQKCTHLIDELYACCDRYYKANGEDATKPLACPKPDLLQLKLKQRSEQSVDAKLVR